MECSKNITLLYRFKINNNNEVYSKHNSTQPKIYYYNLAYVNRQHRTRVFRML